MFMFIIGYEFLHDVGKVGVEGICYIFILTRLDSCRTDVTHIL